MNKVFSRFPGSDIPMAMTGRGCYLIDSDGKQYLDGSGGAAVSCLGHGDREVITRITEQMKKLAFAHTGFFTSEPAEELADLLIHHAPGELDRVYFVSGGSEAIEAAVKLARQYFLEKGETGRSRVISRQQSYHGSTLGALALGGNNFRRQPFEPLMLKINQISPCYSYRGQGEGESEFDYGQRAANLLEDEIQAVGVDQVMAFVAEPVVGATLGAVPAVDGYFKRIREICDQYGILLILDEVMCGMGRTGSLYACVQDGIVPDIMTIAKGLGAGYQPIGATLCSRDVYQTIEQGSGLFAHGHTYLGHPVACSAGLAVVNALIERNLIERCVKQGEKLHAALEAQFQSHPYIGDIRGRGLFRGLEIVRDKYTKEPFDPCLDVHKQIKKAAFEAGLVCYPMGGTIDGYKGDHVLLAPPFIIEDDQIGELCEKLTIAINTATGF